MNTVDSCMTHWYHAGMKTSSHGGRRTGSGRPKGSAFQHQISVRISQEQLDTAKRIGDRDTSAGIRAALDAAKNNSAK